jgi:hypothetical protein
MKFTLSWLKEHLDTDAGVEAILVNPMCGKYDISNGWGSLVGD